MDYSARALESLSDSQKQFIYNLPKAELHAHLNGSIPLSELKSLALEYQADLQSSPSPSHLPEDDPVQKGIQKILSGPIELKEIHDFFDLFPAVYALTSTPAALARVTKATLASFLETPLVPGPDGNPNAQASYIELRTTPRTSPNGFKTRKDYVVSVLDEVEKYPADKAALILSTDRRWSEDDIKEVVDVAIELRQEGRRVVAVDICGTPTVGNLDFFETHFKRAKDAGLGIVLHIAEAPGNTHEDSLRLLSFNPDRLGHATFLNEEARSIVNERGICVEIALSSNLLCKTVTTLDDHHIKHYLTNGHPVTICTDDILIFRSTLTQEYALLLAAPPLGLGLTEERVREIAQFGMEQRLR